MALSIKTDGAGHSGGYGKDHGCDRRYSFPEMEKEARMKLLDQCCSMENDYLREHGGVLYPKLEETLSELKESIRSTS